MSSTLRSRILGGYFGIPENDALDLFSLVTFEYTIDPDSKDDEDTAITGKSAQASVKLFQVLRLAQPTGTDVVAHPFSVRSAAAAGTQVGVVGVMGGRTDETIDIISNSVNFDVAPRRVGGSDMQAVINVKEGADLSSLIGDSETFTVTANGSFVPTRTDAVKVTVSVTASNETPVIIDPKYDSTDEVLPITYSEDDVSDAILISALITAADEDDVKNELYDFSDSLEDEDTLKFTLSGEDSSSFDIDSETGILTLSGDISRAALTEADDGADEDDDLESTDYVDESKDYYTVPSGGEFSNGEDKTNAAFDDVTYKFTVDANDRANTASIDVEFTIDVNKPVSKISDVGELEYKTTDVQNHEIVDLTDYVTGSDSTLLDKVQYIMDPFPANPPFGIYLGKVRVNYPGPTRAIPDDPATDEDEAWDPETMGWRVTVLIGDAFNNGDAPTYDLPLAADAEADAEPEKKAYEDDDLDEGVDSVLIFTIKQIPGPPLQSFDLVFEVDENAVAGTVIGSLGPEVEGAVAFSVISGTGDARDDFAVDEITGEITVVNGRDYDAVGAENNIVLLVDAFGENGIRLGAVIAGIAIQNLNEVPEFAADAVSEATVNEDAQDGAPVATIVATDQDGDTITFSIMDAAKMPFNIDSDGNVTVKGNDAFDINVKGSYELTINASDGTLSADHMVTVTVENANDAPYFDAPVLEITIPENTAVGTEIADYDALDPDRDALTFTIKTQTDTGHFGLGAINGKLTIATGLDYETQQVYLVEINVSDPFEAEAEIQVLVTVTNVNDNSPVFDSAPATSLSVPENTARGFVLANYSATDADGDTVKYSLSGDDAKSFKISDTGDLMTLESLDADRQVPCGADGCAVTVTASDMPGAESGERVGDNLGYVDADVRISVTAIEDSVSTLGVTKANPVPGTEAGHPMSALAGAKTGGDEYLWNLLDCAGMLELVDSTDEAAYCKMWDGLSAEAKTKVSAALTSEAPAESPYSLPASYGSAPVNFVETEWANWGTIVRIEVTAESPSATCGNGNQCVVIDVNSDSADTSIKLQAFRSGSQENKFVAALKLVELSGDATDSTDAGVYQHKDGGVAALKVDEEDEIEVEFGNLRGSIDVENEDPEISNFAPEHEAAFDDADVDYTFTVTDSNSGMPEPEDLPDGDGDADYTPVVALISTGQCETHDGSAATVKTDGGTLSMAASINEDESLYCPGTAQDGEYDASVGSTFGFAPIRDDKDFKEIDDGFDVETTIVLRENKKYYVTFIACDNAGNCSFYDPDGNDDFEELAQITVDTEDPVFVEARTGLTWDSTDNEYDDNRSYIQVIFNDLTTLNTATVEIDDFVVEGHTIKDVHIFENPDDDDVDWADSGDYGADGHPNKRHIDRYRDLENAVFLELEDELLADETPDVTIVPNGVEDSAGNEQDDGDNEADDWISPSFTIVSIVSTRETSQDEILAGDDDEVTVVVTTDERLDSTRPTVTVTYVNAPAGSVRTKGTEDCDDGTTEGGTRERGEIAHEGNDNCLDSDAATGGNLNNSVEKVSNTEWIVTITEPKDTGYYNFRISGKDRSPQENPGSEGVSPSAIVTDFFDADGDVNVDDAIFFEGDINLPKPEVRVSGVGVRDNEADVEFRSPLFVELDFAANHHEVCGRNADTDERMANCTNENGEYAEDNFDDIVVTSFVLDGVDLTDSVKTTDNQSFLVSLESISIGDHTATVQAVDQAGNVFEDTLEIDFEVNDRDPFEKRLSPGWNLVSLPGEPADSSIASVFGPGVEVRTVYSYDPVIPGGWQVAVRETLDSDWQGDLTEITGQRGYWVLSDAIQDWEVSIPRLAGGASGTGTPIQPPVIPMYAGWNLIPVTDVSGNALSAGVKISAHVYLNSLDDGLDLARVLGYNTIKNEWFTVLDMQMGSPGDLRIGSGYWVFVREAAALVPGGVAE